MEALLFIHMNHDLWSASDLLKLFLKKVDREVQYILFETKFENDELSL